MGGRGEGGRERKAGEDRAAGGRKAEEGRVTMRRVIVERTRIDIFC